MKPTRLLFVVLACLPLAGQEFQAWARRLEGRPTRVSAGLWDLETGKLLEGRNTGTALVPASTTKVVSTYALMKTWKPDFQLETEVLGDLAGGVVNGDLVLRGDGDPFLTSERIYLLVQELKARGVTRISGRVRLDQGAFDDRRLAPGWGNTSNDTTPPILPLSVNFNRENGRLVADPERLAVEVVTRLLREGGIAVDGGAAGTGEPRRILTFPSLPLRQMIGDINKWSNNFMAEMLVKRFGGGTWEKGIQQIQAFYQSVLDLGPDQIAITDGSGLSKDNRLSARTLAIVLRAAWHDFEVGPEWAASLKVIGGEPFRLRVKDPNLARRVRCKTGHLDNVTSVCGYLQTPKGRTRVFAIILNGPSHDEDVWEQVSRWANRD